VHKGINQNSSFPWNRKKRKILEKATVLQPFYDYLLNGLKCTQRLNCVFLWFLYALCIMFYAKKSHKERNTCVNPYTTTQHVNSWLIFLVMNNECNSRSASLQPRLHFVHAWCACCIFILSLCDFQSPNNQSFVIFSN